MPKVNWRPAVLWALPLAFLGVFYFYPLTRILLVSLTQDGQGLTSLWQGLASSTTRSALSFTLWQAFLSTLLTLIVGLPAAYLFGRFDFRGKSLLRALTAVPFVLPTIVVAVAFSALLGPRGWLNLALMALFDLPGPPIHFANTLTAILIAHIFYNTTIVIRTVGDHWSHLDPRLTAAARALGASRWAAFRRVTFPLLLPAVAAAALLVFLFDFTSFGVILILGGPRFSTLETEIYFQSFGLNNLPLAAVLSLLQLACTLALTVIYTRLAARLQRPLNLRPQAFTQRRLPGRRARLLAGGLVLALLAFFILPLAALAARSFARLDPERQQLSPVQAGLTLDYYRLLADNPRQSMFYAPPTAAIATSLGYASATVALSLALGLPAAWALSHHRRSAFVRFVDPLLMLPLGTSAVTLGLGFIVSLNHPPLDLRASPLLVPLAHTLVAFPFVVRSLVPALAGIQPRLRHAAAVLGASPRKVLLRVDLPLIGRALFVAAAFAFAISLGEFGASSLITRPEYPTMPVMIYRFLSQPGASNYGQALALSAILMAVTALGILAIERLRVDGVGEF